MKQHGIMNFKRKVIDREALSFSTNIRNSPVSLVVNFKLPLKTCDEQQRIIETCKREIDLKPYSRIVIEPLP